MLLATEQEFRVLFDSRRFRLTRIAPTASPLAIVEAKRRPRCLLLGLQLVFVIFDEGADFVRHAE